MQPFRVLALVVTLTSPGILVSPAPAAEYPERNIMVIVPFPPGGASDATARVVTAKRRVDRKHADRADEKRIAIRLCLL